MPSAALGSHVRGSLPCAEHAQGSQQQRRGVQQLGTPYGRYQQLELANAHPGTSRKLQTRSGCGNLLKTAPPTICLACCCCLSCTPSLVVSSQLIATCLYHCRSPGVALCNMCGDGVQPMERLEKSPVTLQTLMSGSHYACKLSLAVAPYLVWAHCTAKDASKEMRIVCLENWLPETSFSVFALAASHAQGYGMR